jgi:hypothetical protein
MQMRYETELQASEHVVDAGDVHERIARLRRVDGVDRVEQVQLAQRRADEQRPQDLAAGRAPAEHEPIKRIALSGSPV